MADDWRDVLDPKGDQGRGWHGDPQEHAEAASKDTPTEKKTKQKVLEDFDIDFDIGTKEREKSAEKSTKQLDLVTSLERAGVSKSKAREAKDRLDEKGESWSNIKEDLGVDELQPVDSEGKEVDWESLDLDKAKPSDLQVMDKESKVKHKIKDLKDALADIAGKDEDEDEDEDEGYKVDGKDITKLGPGAQAEVVRERKEKKRGARKKERQKFKRLQEFRDNLSGDKALTRDEKKKLKDLRKEWKKQRNKLRDFRNDFFKAKTLASPVMRDEKKLSKLKNELQDAIKAGKGKKKKEWEDLKDKFPDVASDKGPGKGWHGDSEGHARAAKERWKNK